jgi:anti-sigma regulatory factor (Ser/Thr protein kinase)
VEIIQGAVHRLFPMGDESRVGEARRHAALLARDAAFDEVDAGRVAIVVTELGKNLVRHAQNGRLLVCAHPSAGEIEVIALDGGPGIADIGQSMGDGFSTGGTPGTGLGAVRRLSDDFDIHSAIPGGTVILSRVRRKGIVSVEAAAVEVRGISVPVPGETACGDGWAAVLDGAGATLLVADGLGHGPDAAAASQAATGVLAAHPREAPSSLLERVHLRLRSTRGAAVAILRADTGASRLQSCGAGNVVARVITGVSDRTLLMQHGTAGLQIRRPEQIEHEWPQHAVLVLHSDGITTRWNEQQLAPVLGRDPAMICAVILREHCRGRDDATVVVARRKRSAA